VTALNQRQRGRDMWRARDLSRRRLTLFVMLHLHFKILDVFK
jgi:hypothetical protein